MGKKCFENFFRGLSCLWQRMLIVQEPKGLSVAPKTLANFLERKTQLYEQGADVRRIGQNTLFKFLSPKLRHQPNLFALGNKLGW